MKRLIAITFAACYTALIVVTLALAVSWVGGYWYFQNATLRLQSNRTFVLWTSSGYMLLGYESPNPEGASPAMHRASRELAERKLSFTRLDQWDDWGPYPRNIFGIYTGYRPPDEETPWMVTVLAPVSYYFAFLAALVLVPAVSVYRALRARHRSSQDCCVNCGYDLRATPGRCPECGAEPAAEGT